MITVEQNVTEVNITVEQSGTSIQVQPVITRNASNTDNNVDGGTP